MSPSIEPFNEVKYKALMDGLECNEVLMSSVRQYEPFRVDSHFYEKKYAKVKSALSVFPCEFLKNLVSKPIQTGHTPSMLIEEYYGGTIPLVKTNNLHENEISTGFSHYLTPKGNTTISRTELSQDDIITTIIGASEEIVARSALVTKEILPANINQNIVQIRINPRKMMPEYVNAYLNSFYGKQYLLYLSRQTEQVNLNCKEVEIVLIPEMSEKFQEKIAILSKSADEQLEKARKTYGECEELLGDFKEKVQDKAPVTSVKLCSESYGKSGRLDAEYYQNKYEYYEKLLNTSETVKSLCEVHDRTFVPKENEDYRYIELSNVGSVGEISGVDTVVGINLPSRARRKVKKGQVLVPSVEGSLQSCALITNDFDECLCSTGFYVLDSNQINSETLLVLFKSNAIQSLMKQRCSGTILAGITKDELLSMPLPKIDDELQKRIANKVQHSFELRARAKQLLEDAKCAVEMAIEQGEDIALKWLESKMIPEEV